MTTPLKRQIYACIACFNAVAVVNAGRSLYLAAQNGDAGWAVFFCVMALISAFCLQAMIQEVGK